MIESDPLKMHPDDRRLFERYMQWALSGRDDGRAQFIRCIAHTPGDTRVPGLYECYVGRPLINEGDKCENCGAQAEILWIMPRAAVK